MKTIKPIMALLLSLFCATSLADENPIPYPSDYRNWQHIKSMVIQPGHALANPFQGIHHIYANKKALKGFQSNQFPDGAVIVFDLLDYAEHNHTPSQRQRSSVFRLPRISTKHRFCILKIKTLIIKGKFESTGFPLNLPNPVETEFMKIKHIEIHNI